MNAPKRRGTAAETAVVRFLQANGYPHAERRALRGRADCGDVTGVAGAGLGVVIRRRRDRPDVGEWFAVLSVRDLLRLLEPDTEVAS